MVLENIKGLLKKGDNFLVSAHINPDGDAIGSVLVFSEILDRFHKSYRLILQDPAQDKFSFLSNFNKISLYYEEIIGDFQVENIIVLDCSNLQRLGEVQKLLPLGVPILNIDHHPDNDNFGTINFIDKDASGNCELIYEVVKYLGIGFDHRIASQIYTSIMFDTGRFRFSNTTGRALRICAEMVEQGASPDIIANAVYFNMPKASIVALGKVLNSLELHFHGRVGLIHLGYDDMTDDGEVIQDMDGFVDYPLSIRGVDVAIFAREQEKGKFRVSLRAKDKVKVNEIAHFFQGGGHFKAAGCRLRGTIEEVKERLLSETKKHL